MLVFFIVVLIMLQLLESLYGFSNDSFDQDDEIDLVCNQLADYFLSL